MCETDTYRLHKRLSELSVDRGKKYVSQLYSGMLVVSMVALGLIAYDCYSHPTGVVATQAKELMSLLPTGSTVASKKTPNSL